MLNKKRLTNEEFVVELMNGYLTNGISPVLVQAMVIESIIKHTKAVSKADPSIFPKNDLISPEAWIETAKRVYDASNKQYGGYDESKKSDISK